jgi:hypothetical protein
MTVAASGPPAGDPVGAPALDPASNPAHGPTQGQARRRDAPRRIPSGGARARSSAPLALAALLAAAPAPAAPSLAPGSPPSRTPPSPTALPGHPPAAGPSPSRPPPTGAASTAPTIPIDPPPSAAPGAYPRLALPRVPRAPLHPEAAYRPPATRGGACATGAPLALLVPAEDTLPLLLIDEGGAPRPVEGAALATRLGSAARARALGCPGGDRLLLVADGDASAARLAEALRLVTQQGAQRVDLQVEAAAVGEAATGAAPAGPHTLVRVGHGGIVLDGPRPLGEPPLGWGCPAPCAPADQPWAELERALARLPPGAALVLALPVDRPVAEVARTLAAAPPWLAFALAHSGGLPADRPPAGPLLAPAVDWALGPGPVSSLPILMPELQHHGGW